MTNFKREYALINIYGKLVRNIIEIEGESIQWPFSPQWLESIRIYD